MFSCAVVSGQLPICKVKKSQAADRRFTFRSTCRPLALGHLAFPVRVRGEMRAAADPDRGSKPPLPRIVGPRKMEPLRRTVGTVRRPQPFQKAVDQAAAGQKAQAKKDSELEKQLAELGGLLEKSQAAEKKLQEQNAALKQEQAFKELQAEKLTQYWTLTQQQLSLQERKAVELEAKMQRLKTIHVEQVSVSWPTVLP